MVFEYFSLRKGNKTAVPHETPVLTDEDEHFLHKLTAEAPAPPLPERAKNVSGDGDPQGDRDAEIAVMAAAEQVPLPMSPPVETDPESKSKDDEHGDEQGDSTKGEKKSRKEDMKRFMAYLPTLPRRSSKGKEKVKSPKEQPEDPPRDQDELTSVLDQLNLAAVNNRLFSFSKESHELMERFTLVLKDIVNGVPTAYDDLEKLLTGSEDQLQHIFGGMPPWLQSLVKSLPAKVTASLGPELLAAASEKPTVTVSDMDADESKEKKKGKKSKTRVPGLKTMISQQGAVTTMLRSLLNFLRLRFPTVLAGTNVLMSLAVFLLMLVFWYLHKRGRETRLARESAKENDETARDHADIDDSVSVEADPGTPQEGSGQHAAAEDMPSVLNLPEPAQKPLSEPQPSSQDTPVKA